MAITDQMLDELLRDYQKPEDLLGKNGLLKQLQKRLLEKALGAELTVHFGPLGSHFRPLGSYLNIKHQLFPH
jgi:FKBP-type peptidyl-prolyl cis-trans isomerase 2